MTRTSTCVYAWYVWLVNQENECTELQTICNSLMDELEAIKGIQSAASSGGNGNNANNGGMAGVISPRRAGMLAGLVSPSKRTGSTSTSTPTSTSVRGSGSGIPKAATTPSTRVASMHKQQAITTTSSTSTMDTSSIISRDSNGRALLNDRLDQPVHDNDETEQQYRVTHDALDESF
jgi:hypothetical protein